MGIVLHPCYGSRDEPSICALMNCRNVWFHCCSVLCVAVPLIARVAVQFVTSSSLEVVAHLTTNGGRDVQHYYVGLCGMMYTL